MRIRSNEKTCPVCGKIFTIPALKYYTYKRTRQGKRPCEIMDETGCTEGTVRYWSDRMNIGG